jgi:hypothetical protein
VRGMIVQDQLDCGVSWIGGIEKLEKFNEFAATMTVPDERDAASEGKAAESDRGDESRLEIRHD